MVPENLDIHMKMLQINQDNQKSLFLLHQCQSPWLSLAEISEEWGCSGVRFGGKLQLSGLTAGKLFESVDSYYTKP